MSGSSLARKPVILVEGDGDLKSVPFLIRRLAEASGLYDLIPCPNPIKCGEIPKLRKEGQLERFVQYACSRSEGDSVILVVDCDDDCPVTTSGEFAARAKLIAQNFKKKVGIAFIQKEFETLFLYSLRELSVRYPEHGWLLKDSDTATDWTAVRGAKGELNRRMKSYTYKETRDQVKFVSAIDIEIIVSRCRSAMHLQRLINWMYSADDGLWVYPVVFHG
jgi:hypothetical protein